MADEFSLDAKADAVVDLAMSEVDRYMSRDDRDSFREKVQDAVDALIDECRAYYAELHPPQHRS